MFHPNSNSRYRRVKSLICSKLLHQYRNGLPPTQQYDNNGHPLSDILRIYTEDELIARPAITINGPYGQNCKVVAHVGQSSPKGLSILLSHS